VRERLRASALALVVAIFCLLGARPVLAHDLAIDELSLRPNRSEGRLRGQLTFDPALTRARDERLLSAEIEARLLAFVAANVTVEADGKKLELRRSMREIYVPAGAAPGDIVMLDAALPAETHELRVVVGKAFRVLAVSVELPPGAAGGGEQSVLVLGGEATPPYRFAATVGDGWKAGPASQFGLAAAPHDRAAPVPRANDTGFAPPSVGATALRYLVLGVTHILPSGLDHVLFVLALVLGTGYRPRRLLVLLSLFTVAHTLTLVAGALDVIVFESAVIEPLIALSIAFVALENLLFQGNERFRPYVVVAFGLLHGQGFAGALKETGAAKSSFLVSLLSFNVGVEIGQLVVALAGALGLRWVARRPGAERALVRGGSTLIALVGLIWTVLRLT